MKEKKGKEIVCVETGKRYRSCSLLARELDVAVSSVTRAVKEGHRCGGNHYIYEEDYSPAHIGRLRREYRERPVTAIYVRRPVVNITTGERYESVTEASIALGVSLGAVCNALRRGRHTAGCLLVRDTSSTTL